MCSRRFEMVAGRIHDFARPWVSNVSQFGLGCLISQGPHGGRSRLEFRLSQVGLKRWAGGLIVRSHGGCALWDMHFGLDAEASRRNEYRCIIYMIVCLDVASENM